MVRSYAASVLGMCLLVLGCQSDEPASSWAEMIDVPSEPGSGQPHLHVGAGGRVWMSWIEAVDTTHHTLRYAAFDGTTWSQPKTVASGSNWFVNWADVPSISTLPDGRLAAHFLERSGPSPFAYDVRIAQTANDGVWQQAITPHHDDTATEHGFVSLLPWSGNLLALWLDGRQMASNDGDHGQSSGAMTLRSALITPSGAIDAATVLDDRVCECCPTSAVRTESGVLVAYRDRSETEVRNIQLMRFDGEQWSQPYVLHDDGWQIDGCPVNGPALAANGDHVAAAWFTAANNTPRVQVAFSNDGGRQFGDPIVVDDSGPQGHVDVALLNDGSALVSWEGSVDRRRAIRVRHVSLSRSMGPPQTIVQPTSPAVTGIPRMVQTGDYVYIAWVDVKGPIDSTRLRMARPSVDDFR